MFVCRWRGASGITAVLCAVLLVLASCFIPTLAYADDAAPEVSLEITADKQAYQPGETAHLTLTASHDAGNGIRDVAYEVKLPGAFDASKAQLSGELDDMAPGDVRTVELDVPVLASESNGAPALTDPTDTNAEGAGADEKASNDTTGNSSGSAADAQSTPLAATGDALSGMLALVAVAAALALMVARMARERKRAPRGRHAKPASQLSAKASPVLSVLLAVSLTGAVGVAGTAVALAAEGASTATAKTTVQISGTDHELTAVLNYVPIQAGAGAGDDEGAGDDGDIIYQDGVKVLEADEAFACDRDSVSALVADGTDVVIGDIIVIKPDTANGDYIGGVMRITRIDDSVSPRKVYGEIPAFEEAIKSMHLDTSTIGIAEPIQTASVSQASRSQRDDERGWDWSWDTLSDPGTISVELVYKGENDGGAASFSVTGTLTPSADISVDYDAPSFSQVSVTNTTEAHLKVEGSVQVDHTFKIAELSLPTPIWGLYVLVDLGIKLSAEGQASLDIGFSLASGFKASESGISPVCDPKLNISGEASVELGLDLVPSISVGLFWLEIADLSLLAGPHGSASLTVRPDGPPYSCGSSTFWLNVALSLAENEGTALSALADLVHFALPSWTLLDSGPGNPTRFEAGHIEDGDLVDQCTYGMSTSPVWRQPTNQYYNRLEEPLALRAGNALRLGDKDLPGYEVGGIGISVTYKLMSYGYSLSKGCVMRVTIYNDDGTMKTRFLKGKDGTIHYLEGSTELFLGQIEGKYPEETVIEVLKGTLVIDSILTTQIPPSQIETCETFASFDDALDALEKEEAIQQEGSNDASAGTREMPLVGAGEEGTPDPEAADCMLEVDGDREQREGDVSDPEEGDDAFIAEYKLAEKVSDETGGLLALFREDERMAA